MSQYVVVPYQYNMVAEKHNHTFHAMVQLIFTKNFHFCGVVWAGWYIKNYTQLTPHRMVAGMG